MVPKSSRIYHLPPWLDEFGILRMRSRIGLCMYTTGDAKNPIILPRDHHITTLIINHYHALYHHQNHEIVINQVRQKYHVPRIRVCYAKVRRACQKCKNDTAIPHPLIMADLPLARLSAYSRPFTHTGVDYFGPMDITVGRRTEKRWGMLATCLTVRAIQFEIVYTLSTDSCIMALRNFIARRGVPRRFYSDRGTNFIGANRKLCEIESKINQENIMKEFVSTETEWLFNPPASPHMGGSWKRLIRSVKNNLAAMKPSRKLSEEVLRNLLAEFENIVNSRPLTHVPIDDLSASALTPNHFLLGSSNGTKPLTNLDDSGVALRMSWCTSQILANQFWKRWVTDYLPEITRRTK
ncbi:uncharacterized protein LOC129766680 [Toxorhynchites rutilus septentrionalis]|uniref:uncharacterized protein LOC129766680 n=1 Tax=Toxorhynchites rutilus septentrionalis TaxID=329112 RepID=UPI002479D79C|nr:uncharacterized protein LOC129766680 [Toxorhynchites rutilus septentrionalis]